MKNKNIGIGPIKSLINRALVKIQLKFANSLTQLFRIDSDLIVKTHRERFRSYHCFWSQCIYYITVTVCSPQTWCWKDT